MWSMDQLQFVLTAVIDESLDICNLYSLVHHEVIQTSLCIIFPVIIHFSICKHHNLFNDH